MTEDDYRRIVDLAQEEPTIDFKGPMAWDKAHECSRLELLTDVAALCTYGGGVIVIGRHDDDKRSGSLSEEQLATFEVTRVNQDIGNYLRPMPSVRVVPLRVADDFLVILDVPPFTETPPCFQKQSQCREKAHVGDRRHFSQGDVYIRTAAAQTVRVSQAEEWRAIWNQILRNVRETESHSEREPTVSQYDVERRDDDAKHVGLPQVPNMMGTLNLTFEPVEYLADRVPRLRLRPTLEHSRASLEIPGKSDLLTMPYRATTLHNMSGGMFMLWNQPDKRECEGGMFHRSGLFSFRRIFGVDFNSERSVTGVGVLPLFATAAELRLAFTMLSNLAGEILDPDESVDITMRLAGLANRSVEDDSASFGARVPILLTLGTGQVCIEPEVRISRRLSAAELIEKHFELAIDAYQEVLWIFGIEPTFSQVEHWQAAFADVSSSTMLQS